jgi:hypothetical protein
VTAVSTERKAAFGAESSSVATRRGRGAGRNARSNGPRARSAAAVGPFGSGSESATDSAISGDIGKEPALVAGLDRFLHRASKPSRGMRRVRRPPRPFASEPQVLAQLTPRVHRAGRRRRPALLRSCASRSRGPVTTLPPC